MAAPQLHQPDDIQRNDSGQMEGCSLLVSVQCKPVEGKVILKCLAVAQGSSNSSVAPLLGAFLSIFHVFRKQQEEKLLVSSNLQLLFPLALY